MPDLALKALLAGWTTPEISSDERIRRYSATGDILSFKRCRRQYGYFGVRGFASATNVQRYFGTLVHDVMYQIHVDHRAGVALPTREDDRERIQQLVATAHERLVRSGVRPFNPAGQQEHAVDLIQRFVSLVGPHFFPHITTAEFRLERSLRTRTGQDYILEGIVDVLAGAVSHDLGIDPAAKTNDVEIWDYKSGRNPGSHRSAELRDYVFQMRVYAELYRQQQGRYPARCVLAFMGELGNSRSWAKAQGRLSAFPQLLLSIPFDRNGVAEAMTEFHETVDLIETERARPYPQQWAPPRERPSDETCEACELRFHCSSYPEGASLRRQPL